MFRRNRILATAALVAVLIAQPAVPQANPGPSNFTIGQLAAVDLVNSYLNDLRTLQGNFVQTAPDGQVTQGRVFLERPGKLRFEYAPPSKLRVVSDGRWVAVQDDHARTNDRYPLSSTPLKLLLAPNVDLMQEARILDVDPDGELVSISLEPNGEAVGRLTLMFDPVSNELKRWRVTDVQGLDTTVQLQDTVHGQPIDARFFRIVENRPVEVAPGN